MGLGLYCYTDAMRTYWLTLDRDADGEWLIDHGEGLAPPDADAWGPAKFVQYDHVREVTVLVWFSARVTSREALRVVKVGLARGKFG